MFGKFSEFWIKNYLLTNILIAIILLFGVFSWISVPKQYQPDIIQPVYAVIIPAPGYSQTEISDYAIIPFQKKMSEILGVEHVSSTTSRDYGVITVKFEGGIDSDIAFTRLTNKITNSLQILPKWTNDISVRSLDINDIPVFTLAIHDTSIEQNPENLITLKKIANSIMKKTQSIQNVSSQYLVGGEDNDIQVFLDLDKLEARNIDLLQVYSAVNTSNIRFVGGTFSKGGVDNILTIDAGIRDRADIESLVVGNYNNIPVLLSDVATIKRGIGRIESSSRINTGSGNQNAVFIGIAKKKGSNSVNVIQSIRDELTTIQKEIPPGYELSITQDEGAIASTETNHLLREIGNTIIILFVILVIFLGFQDAIGSALSIPIVLSLVFGFAYFTGDNINQLTLFALILSLGMLVDDSIVVVENISRHMALSHNHHQNPLTTIIQAVEEIGPAIILSTITKILSFVGLFFMTGVFGQYTFPIPKYLTLSLILSILVSLAINPYISYLFEKWKSGREKKNGKSQTSTHNQKEGYIMRVYEKMLHWVLSTHRRRIVLKVGFFLILAGFLSFLPLELVKTTSLPPSNDSQIYIWIDTPRDTTYEQTQDIAQNIGKYLEQYISSSGSEKHKVDDPRIIKSISFWVGMAPSLDNASLGLGGVSRIGKNQISIKIDLLDAGDREIVTSQYILKIRNNLNAFLVEYPGIKARYLLPPSGPAKDANFILRISGEANDSDENVIRFTEWIKQKIHPIIKSHDIVDYYDSISGYQNHLKIRVNNEYVARLGLDSNQIANSIYGLFHPVSAGLFTDTNSKEETHINILVPDIQRDDPELLSRVSFMNPSGKRILLGEIADTISTREGSDMYSYDGFPTIQILGDTQGKSAEYPMKNLIARLETDEFWEGQYEIVNISNLECIVQEKTTGKQYKIQFDGDWKTSQETNTNLGQILVIALLLLFIIIAVNFQSFQASGVLMLTFLLGFFGIMPGFALMYFFYDTYMSATSLIGIISITGIAIGNGIIFLEYYLSLRKSGEDNITALIHAGKTRMRPILLTSVTAIIGAAMIANDPIWGGLAYVLIFGLAASATLMLIVIPVFLYDIYDKKDFR